MNLVALETFLAVVQTGHLNKAADLMNVTQSTVTARLDALDTELGQALLVRSRKGAQLTKAGFAFQRHAELMVRTWEQARKTVGLPSGFSGMVSLATHDELWPGLGERWIDLAQAMQQDIAFEAWPGEHADISRWLNSGLVDAAITLLPVTGVTSRLANLNATGWCRYPASPARRWTGTRITFLWTWERISGASIHLPSQQTTQAVPRLAQVAGRWITCCA